MLLFACLVLISVLVLPSEERVAAPREIQRNHLGGLRFKQREMLKRCRFCNGESPDTSPDYDYSQQRRFDNALDNRMGPD